MRLEFRTPTPITILAILFMALAGPSALAQRGRGGSGFGLDPRAEDRTYHFEDTDEDLPYCLFASSKVSPGTPAPLIVSLHGLGAGPEIMCNTTAVDLAEEGGYVLVSPMGYNVGGWYGSPVISFGGRGGRGGEEPENLAELSEKDVMNVLAMVREEFNIDDDRIYLTGHSMGGAGTYFLASKHNDLWAAVAPVAPASFMMNENRAEVLQGIADGGIPIMVVHGDTDEVVPVQNTRDWVATMEEIGMEHEYVELPNVTHGPVITASQESVYEFFGRHSK